MVNSPKERLVPKQNAGYPTAKTYSSTDNTPRDRPMGGNNMKQNLENGNDGTPVKKCTLSRSIKIIFYVLLGLALTFIVLVYVVVPITYVSSPFIRRTLVFLAFNTNGDGLSNPEEYGLNCSRNFYLKSETNISIGTWYIPPTNATCDKNAPMFQGNERVILYLHGISSTRRSINRVKLAKLLTNEVGVHVLSIDYRGFGDSTRETPSLQGVVNDSLAAYNFIRRTENVTRERIFIWGHSLGTSVAMYVAAQLNKQLDNPAGVILESAFDKITEVAGYSRWFNLYRWLPWFRQIFMNPLANDPGTNFDSVSQSSLVGPQVPFLMLHAEDDKTIPISNGRVLQRALVKSRQGVLGAANVTFVAFGAQFGYGHSGLPWSPKIAHTAREFIKDNSNT